MSPKRKEFVFLAVLIVVSVLFWYLVSVFLAHSAFSDFSWPLASLIVTAFIFVVIWALISVLVESSALVALAWACASYAGVIWFRDPIFLGVASLLFIFGIIGYFRAKSALRITFEGRLTYPLRKSIPLTVTFIVAAFSVSYYLVTAAVPIDLASMLPESFFERTIAYSTPAIRKVFPNFNSNGTVGDFVLNQIRKESVKLNHEQELFVINESIIRMRKELGFNINANDPYTRLLYLTGVSAVEKQVTDYKKYFPVVYAIGLFLTLRFLSIPFYMLAIGVCVLILRIFHRFGIVEMRAIPASILAYSLS